VRSDAEDSHPRQDWQTKVLLDLCNASFQSASH